MMITGRRYQKGFTIIEVIIVIGIFGLLLVALMTLFEWHNKIYSLEQANTRATGSARVTLNNMTKYIAQASLIETSRTISGTTYTTDSDTVVLKLPSFDSSGNIISATFDYVVYNKNGSVLSQITELGSGSSRSSGTKTMSPDVTTLSLTYNNADVTLATNVIVDLTTAASWRGNNTVSAHVTDTIFLRNHD